MKVTVRTVASGEEESYTIQDTCTTSMLKDLIHEHSGVSPDYQELRHLLPTGETLRLCQSDFTLKSLTDSTSDDSVELELLYNLHGGEAEDEEDEGEYGPSPDHILCCCGFRSLPGEKLVCCLTVGCGIREGKPLCEVCFSSCSCTLL